MVIDKTWHLAETEEEIKVTEFELQLWRIFYGFIRWQEECEKTANNTDLTGNELAVLHVIRMKNRPKTISDIGRLLNRDDTFNIKYSLRKLVKKKLIQSTVGSKRASSYQITEEGIKNTDSYTATRRNILIELFVKNHDLDLEDLAEKLAKFKGIYDEAVRAVASYTAPLEPHPEKEKTIKKIKKS